MKILVILLLAAAKPAIAASPSLDSHRVAWTSERVHRVLVTVPAAEIGEREMDDAPAALIFDAKRSIGARIDVRTIEVVRVDPATGQPLPGDGWAYAPQPEHRTFRWLDDAIPRDFPEVPGSLSRTDKPVVRLAANVGHTYAATGTWEAGRLTFMHTQTGREPSYYAIYFDALAAADQPAAEPRGWVGDGLPRCDLTPDGTFETAHVRICLDDFDGDGKLDIGPIEADGKPINVGDWCAAPSVADLDGDGLPDLVSGSLPMTSEGSASRVTLRWYRNVGSSGAWRFTEQPLPVEGSLPLLGMATPRIADVNGDSLPDIVFSSNQSIYVMLNFGTATEPMFKAPDGPVTLPWGPVSLASQYFLDYNRDGRLDMVNGYRVYLAEEGGNPFRFSKPLDALHGQPHIRHDSGVGDDWFWPRLADFNGNGAWDILFGDFEGHVWLHENKDGAYDQAGVKLAHRDGRPIQVGPASRPEATGFTKLQGARTVFAAADFDGDGDTDLVIGDTFGDVHFAENVGDTSQPVFAELIQLGSLKQRLMLDAADYDGDGRPDVVAGAANGNVLVWLNNSSDGIVKFDEAFEPGLPPIKQPRLLVVDLNADGDSDLYSPSTVGSVWIERSFLERGYAVADVITVARKP